MLGAILQHGHALFVQLHFSFLVSANDSFCWRFISAFFWIFDVFTAYVKQTDAFL